jgi:CBS domain
MSKWKWAKNRSIEAAIGAIVFLLLGLGVVWFAKTVAGVTSSAVLSVLAIMPALLYVILRGDLAELRGPGGWAATFKVTNAAVTFSAQKFDIVTEAQIIQKGSLSELDRLTSKFDRNQPVLMTISMNAKYEVHAMERYLETFTSWPRFKLVAFLDESGHFIGCASANGFYRLIRNYQLAHEFLSIVGAGDQREIFRYPGILRNVINTEATNAEALAAMDQHGLGALAVVDEDRHVKGIVEREQLMSTLILSMVKDATGNRQ